MKTIINRQDENICSVMEVLYPSKRIVYYDIETTGLSAANSMIYLIGIAYYKEGAYEIVQFFAEDAREEEQVIAAFFDAVKGFDIIVSFNGDSFDRRFIDKRRGYLTDFSKGELCFLDEENLTSIDLFKMARKYQKMFGLENCRQKTIEQLLGVDREDSFSGGELIEDYRTYLLTKQENLYNRILLHNYEDMKGLLLLSNLMIYQRIFQGDFKVSEVKENEEEVILYCTIPMKVCAPFVRTYPDIAIDIRENQMTVHVKIIQEKLRYYYPNYKDYYYLIDEQTVIHKSIGQFVEKEKRVKATKDNCFSEREGRYVAASAKESVDQCYLFCRERKDAIYYLAVDDLMKLDCEHWNQYVKKLLMELVHCK